jgi:single-stranded-DNA-specific exonuclease
VDGVTSLALFTRILRRLGADPHPFLPLRMDEGYGLSPEGLARCVAQHRPQLLLALDCGTCSVAEIASLRAQGVDVLVFDHHESKGNSPPASRWSIRSSAPISITCAAPASSSRPATRC